MAWIELHQELREHKKMFKCAEALNISRVEMIGTLVCLWLWALDNAEDGSLADVSNRTIACVCGFPEKKAQKLVDALFQTGFLDKDEERNCYVIHDWNEYAGKLMERRKNDRERKKNSAGKKKTSAGIPSEFHGSSTENPALPYHNRTITVPNIPTACNNTQVGTGDGGEDAREDGRLFTAFWAAYPATGAVDRERAWEAWKKLNPDEERAGEILSSLEAWKKSRRWREDGWEYIPNAANFLEPGRGYIDRVPASYVPTGGAVKPSMQLGEAELEAIQRALREG